MPDPAKIAATLSEGTKRAILSAEPRRRALDPDSLFVTNSRGAIRAELEPLTMVTLAGLMLNSAGLAVRDVLNGGEND